MTFQGHIENGVAVFDEPVTLPDGLKVRIVPLVESARTPGEQDTGRTLQKCHRGRR